MAKKAYNNRRGSRFGFTLAEILIVVSIIALVAVSAIIGYQKQVTRGFDARRKADLANISSALEEYYNDHNCYPDAGILDACSGTALSPYIPAIPCDPSSHQPYLYIPDTDDPCKGYHTCAALKDLSDSDIAAQGCNPVTGCGWGAYYNYCSAIGSAVVAEGFDASATATPTPIIFGGATATPTPTPTSTPTQTPTPTPIGGSWYCHSNGCHVYPGHPIPCNTWWGTPNTPGACSSLHCASVGDCE